MEFVKPYLDDHKQVIFVEFENKTIHEFVNGALFALVIAIVYISLINLVYYIGIYT